MSHALASADWSLIQAFLMVAEEGSLSAAARRLGASQPTLGRQIKTLERQLNASLFVRQARGLVLTETGAVLVGPARTMRDAMG
ncbi:MAG: LysR family transcriptional regulator, partial [Octadecabacter sp.]